MIYRNICKMKGDIIERNRKREMESLERIIEG